MHTLVRSQHSNRPPPPTYTQSANPSTAPPADDRSYPWKRNENNGDANANYGTNPTDVKNNEETKDVQRSGDETEEESEARSEPPKKKTPKAVMTGLRKLLKIAS